MLYTTLGTNNLKTCVNNTEQCGLNLTFQWFRGQGVCNNHIFRSSRCMCLLRSPSNYGVISEVSRALGVKRQCQTTGNQSSLFSEFIWLFCFFAASLLAEFISQEQAIEEKKAK